MSVSIRSKERLKILLAGPAQLLVNRDLVEVTVMLQNIVLSIIPLEFSPPDPESRSPCSKGKSN